MRDKKWTISLLVITIVGFFFRLWMAGFANNSYPFDSSVYQTLATDVLTNGWFVDSVSRTFYFPVFIAIIWKLFGVHNAYAVGLVQSILDTISGILVGYMSYRITRKRSIQAVTTIMYMINPLTAGYSGFYLTEIFSTFSTVLLLLTCFGNKLPWIFIGITTAVWGTIRLAFFPLALIISIVRPLMTYIHWSKVIRALFLIYIGFIVVMIYPVYADWRSNGSFRIVPMNNTSFFALYEGLRVHVWPEIWNDLQPLPQNIKMHWDYKSLPKEEYAKKVEQLKLEYIREITINPSDFIYWRFVHAFRIWNKTYMFYYEDPFRPVSRIILPYYNFVLLSLSIVGYIYVYRASRKTYRMLLTISFLTIIGNTVLFSLKPPEERLTIPLYPVIILFAGCSVESLFRLFKKIIHYEHSICS